jgi:hypothetical protein
VRNVRAVTRDSPRDIRLIKLGGFPKRCQVLAEHALLLDKLWRLAGHPAMSSWTLEPAGLPAYRRSRASSITSFLTWHLTPFAP